MSWKTAAQGRRINGSIFLIFGPGMINDNTGRPRFDPEILDLIPHRSPMLLINYLESLSASNSSAMVLIDEHATFYEPGIGVPSWIGLEYMGQTAALIAGYQQRAGMLKPNLGFLLGCRHYSVQQDYFEPATVLLVSCVQAAQVGESLVTFDCTIHDNSNKRKLAEAGLSVFRKPNTQTLSDRDING